MSRYPHLSEPKYRICSRKSDDICPTFPCPHVPCHDPDWLEDSEEALANEEVNTISWDLYHSLYGKTPSSTLKDQLSAEEWVFYKPKVERCRRLEGKRKEIKNEMDAYKVRDQIQQDIEQQEVWDELLNDENLKDDPIILARKARMIKSKLLETPKL